MKVSQSTIEGLLLFEVDVYGDSRGYFFEQYNEKKYVEVGIHHRFVQDNVSWSRKGTLRGLHFQANKPQGKLVQVLAGEVFDVAVDLRQNSKTFGQWSGQFLSGENHKQFYIPPGFAHGFYVLSEDALVSYKCTDFYSPVDDRGLFWGDEKINVQWPLVGEPIVSDKDAKLPRFDLVNWKEKISL